MGTQIVCPITQGGGFARSAGFAVPLSGAGTLSHGIVLCNQMRTLDLRSRGARFIEKAPYFVVEDVLTRLVSLFE